MNTKEIYNKPEIVIIEVEMAQVIAASPGSGDIDISDDTHQGGDSMSKGFWDVNF